MFQRVVALTMTLLAGSFCAQPIAHACGGGFGNGLTVDAAQQIVVAHKAGVETYVFGPHFCGAAKDFGLILPVPDVLTKDPSLADKALFEQLEALTKPTIIDKVLCEGTQPPGDGGSVPPPPDADAPSANVIDRGQVGIFDWVLLKADTTAAFTDWLTTNNFPYDQSSVNAFAHYVSKGWHFVAFKVTADDKAPPTGSLLCGNLGPLSLSFTSTEAVIPTRIAGVGGVGPLHWRVFAVADSELTLPLGNGVGRDLRYSGTLTASDMSTYPQFAKIAAAGDRLTKIDLTIYDPTQTTDVVLEPAAQQADFRHSITQYSFVPCDDGGTPLPDGGVQPDAGPQGRPASGDDDGGCTLAASGSASRPLAWLALLGLFLGARRRRRRSIRARPPTWAR